MKYPGGSAGVGVAVGLFVAFGIGEAEGDEVLDAGPLVIQFDGAHLTEERRFKQMAATG